MQRIFSALLVLGILAPGTGAQTPDNEKPDPAKAEKALKDQLAKYNAPGGNISRLTDAAITKSFPNHILFGVHYRQYPVAREMPRPLTYSNLFLADSSNKLTLITDHKTLEQQFKKLSGVKTEEDAKTRARAWLIASSQLHQDGFFRFSVNDEATKVEKGKDGLTAIAKMTVTQGGNGELLVTMTFDKNGQLDRLTETNKIRAGPRPICQATKLLDADPIVRKMAEQQILYLGRLAKDYLAEQRAKASPEVQKAIDALWKKIEEQDR